MSTIEVKVPDIGDFKDVPIIEVFVTPPRAITSWSSVASVVAATISGFTAALYLLLAPIDANRVPPSPTRSYTRPSTRLVEVLHADNLA